jgi:hypothetical protein
MAEVIERVKEGCAARSGSNMNRDAVNWQSL